MAVIDTLRRWAQLAGLVGLAAGTVAIQACTRASPGQLDDAGPDAAPSADAGPDAGLPDADLEDADLEDADLEDAEAPDARLWDVMCE